MMRKLLIISSLLLLLTLLLNSCSSQFNKGVTNKKELRSRKSPSVRIKEGYDKAEKRAGKSTRSLKGKDGKALEKAMDRLKAKKMRKDKRYVKKAKRRAKRLKK